MLIAYAVFSLGILSAEAGYCLPVSDNISIKKTISRFDDPNYGGLCQSDAELWRIETSANMFNPALADIEKGKASLKADRRLIVSDNADYTFVVYIADGKSLAAEAASLNSIILKYQGKTNGAPASETTLKSSPTASITPKALFDTGSVSGLSLKCDVNMYMLFITFHISDTVSGSGSNDPQKATIKSFDFEFNSLGTSGTINHIQLYKGTKEEFEHFGYADYSHESCDLPADTEGPFENQHIYNIQTQYGTNAISEDNLRKTLTAIDKGDGLKHDVVVERNDFSGHEDVLNTPHDIVFKSTDNAKNTSYFTFRITIIDRIAPTISVIDSNRSLSYIVPLTKEMLLENFVFNDNYKNTIPTVKIETELTFDTHALGDFNFVVSAQDISGNITRQDSKITFVDDKPPLITGDEQLVIKAGSPLSDEDIISHFASEDEIDGSCSVLIKSNGYSGHENQVGVYFLSVSSADKTGNESEKTVLISVTDVEGPIFYVNKSMITTYIGTIPEAKNIAAALARNGILEKKNYVSAEFISETFIDGEPLEIGTYEAVLAAYSDDGTAEYADITINVISQEDNEEKNNSFWANVANFFKNIWEAVARFFIKLFAL